MAFATGSINDPQKVGAGERFGSTNIVLTETSFEDQLVVGRFAKLDTGSIDNMDGSATPVIAGVVLRNVASPVEDAGVIDGALFSSVDIMRQGLVSVEVKAGQTPVKFGAVTASNAGDASDGMALAAGGIATGAEFIEEIKTNVWLIRLK